MKAVSVAGLTTSDAAAGLGVLMELKRLLKRRDGDERRAVTVEHYPSHPRDLPAHLFAAAYSSEDPPCCLDEVSVLKQRVWVRKSASAVKKAGGASDMVAVPKLAGQRGGDEQMLMRRMLEFGSMMREVMFGGSGSSGSHGVPAQMFQPRAGSQQALAPPPPPLALTNGCGGNTGTSVAPAALNAIPAVPAAAPAPPPQPAPQTQVGNTAVQIPGPEHVPTPEEVNSMMGGGDTGTQGKAKAAGKPKPAAKGVAQQHLKTKAKAKCEAKHGGVVKPVTETPAKNKWVIEVRHRDSGQTDKHYRSPQGKCYRTLREAKEAGFKE